MRSDTQTITIDADPQRVFWFLADPANLPRWAIGFAKAIRCQEDGWVVETAQGSVGIRYVTEAETGVVDFYMSPSPEVESIAHSRVLSNGQRCEYVFTQYQGSDITDDLFESQVRALAHELVALKALLEVECPL